MTAQRLGAIAIVLVFLASYISCGSDEGDLEEASSTEQAFSNWGGGGATGSVYAHTLTGTSLTWYTRAFHELSPAAQRIIRLHEELHQRQNPFTLSAPCREVPAYQLQMDEARRWLDENDDGKRFDKDIQDVQRLLFDAQELVGHFQELCDR